MSLWKQLEQELDIEEAAKEAERQRGLEKSYDDILKILRSWSSKFAYWEVPDEDLKTFMYSDLSRARYGTTSIIEAQVGGFPVPVILVTDAQQSEVALYLKLNCRDCSQVVIYSSGGIEKSFVHDVERMRRRMLEVVREWRMFKLDNYICSFCKGPGL